MPSHPTLRRRMIVSLVCTVLGAITIGVGSLLAVDGMHQDMSVSVRGFRQLRQLFDVGFLVSRAREATSSSPPQPQQAVAALQLALAKLNERSDPSAVDGPPPNWGDESSRVDCERLMTQSIKQLNDGSGGTASLNLTFGQLAKVADGVRQSIADAQSAANHRQRSAQISILALDAAVIVAALLIGIWQYRQVVDPIHQLTQGVRAFAAGELDRRIWLRADREFVALASDFNKMAQELSALYRDLELKVAEKSKLLVRSEQLAGLGHLAASVAHEINNPLGIIAGYGERAIQRLGEEAADPAQTLFALRVICEEAFRCKQITNRLLTLARPVSDQRAVASLATIAEIVVATLSGLGSAQGRLLKLTADPDADFTVRINEGEIKQLLLNLLINSIDAVDPATGKILVNVFRTGDDVTLSVADNGRGMTTETLSRIFQPFYSERRGQNRGTGLGLSIAQTIATEHGGTLEAQSDGPDTGSAFTLKLPALNKEPAVASV